MRIDIESKKRGYASLEVIAMSLIGFTLVLALLSIALNKRILIKNEIKAYEKKLDNDDERTRFLAEILSSINKENYSDEDLSNHFNLTLDEIKQKEIEILSLLKNDDGVKVLRKTRKDN